MSVFKYEKDQDGIVTITMDMDGPVNAMNEQFKTAIHETLNKLEAETEMTGVVIASAKSTFFAGGDLKQMIHASPDEAQVNFDNIDFTKGELRRLEKLPVPVVAAINGAALGGGFEICLACNAQVMVRDKKAIVGLPEVTLGLLAGGGGVVRTVNKIGLEKALPYLLEGKKVNADAALKSGLINEVVDSLDELIPAAKAWIKGNPEAAAQPWDVKGYKIPGGDIKNPKVAQIIQAAPPMLYAKTRGLLPAPEKTLDVAVTTLKIGFDAALRYESRALANLLVSPQAKNIISSLFFQLNKINAGGSRPKDVAPNTVKKVGVIGAGMMGQGIAYVSAMSGIEVVLKDMSIEQAEKGKAYSEKLLSKRIAKGRMQEDKKTAILSLIKPTASNDDLAGCDLIIEAVFESIELKDKIIKEAEPYLAENGIFGSNTSSLPINTLSKSSAKPENFIGIHFFSPVDKMPLIEIICSEQTSDETLAKAFDYAKQIRKTPIVVNDSLGFFTSRVFGTFLDEGARLLIEGVHPVVIDRMGYAVGMPVGPLAVQDEVSLALTSKVAATHEEMGLANSKADTNVAVDLCNKMIAEFSRGGRYHGGGFYEYPEGAPKHIWPKLTELFHKPELSVPEQDIKDRILFRQVVESFKCLEEGVLRTVADGNIGSIMGIGAPTWTGGFLQFVNTYGIKKFVERCAELEAKYGERFAAPNIVKERKESEEWFQ